MQDELNASTAIEDGIVAVPDGGAGGPGGEPTALLTGAGNNLPPNEPGRNQISARPSHAQVLSPDSTGPPDTTAEKTADYWFGLIIEKQPAEFLRMTDRWLQAKRQHGGGPSFIRISQRCIRYRRVDLKAYTDRQLRSSTSDHGGAADAA